MDRSLTVKTRLAPAASRLDVDCFRSVCGGWPDLFLDSGSARKRPATTSPAINVRANDLLITVFPLVFEHTQSNRAPRLVEQINTPARQGLTHVIFHDSETALLLPVAAKACRAVGDRRWSHIQWKISNTLSAISSAIGLNGVPSK